MDGFTFPGMIDEPGCTAGSRISSNPGRHETQIARDLAEVHRERAKRSAEARRVAHALHELDAVGALLEAEPGDRAQMLDHERGIFGLDIDAGAHRAAPNAEIAQEGGSHRDALQVAIDGDAVGAKLLAQANRHRILQMRAPALEHVVELRALGEQRIAEHPERSDQVARESQRTEPDCGRNHVVGGLRHVDVIVRMDQRIAAARRSEVLVGEVGEHLVHVHVVRRAGAGLVHVDDEVVAMRATQDLIGGGDDRVGQLRIEPARLLVRERRGFLDPDHRRHEHRQRAHPADRKILRGAYRLRAVERGCRNGQRTERVLLGARGAIGSRAGGAGPGGHGQGLRICVLSVLYCDTTSS